MRTDGPSDADLIGRSRQEPGCFAAIFDRHAAEISRYAHARLGPDLAEDVTAETFLAAFRHRDRYDTTRPDARPWLYGIAAYVRIGPWVSDPDGPVTAWPAENCGPAGGPAVPGKVVEAVFPFPAGGGPDHGYAVTIRPAAIPEGDAILIQVTWTQGQPELGIDVQDMVLGTTRPPVCTPARGA